MNHWSIYGLFAGNDHMQQKETLKYLYYSVMMGVNAQIY